MCRCKIFRQTYSRPHNPRLIHIRARTFLSYLILCNFPFSVLPIFIFRVSSISISLFFFYWFVRSPLSYSAVYSVWYRISIGKLFFALIIMVAAIYGISNQFQEVFWLNHHPTPKRKGKKITLF